MFNEQHDCEMYKSASQKETLAAPSSNVVSKNLIQLQYTEPRCVDSDSQQTEIAVIVAPPAVMQNTLSEE